ncbi:GTP-binding protein [Caldalkalibacillus uzonensis]|uniref:Large ribosomal subunit assembly factor BipA n=1 Tax=Caldalkalibacillus uzonensis TaxID=353224 RepID=A0ABU0CSQ4_9BACI|nr:translational GTPase TypA [Caldalkalibacillus uzonensis]MDQ0339138.1 GTP-binding protein [Caldalkalibacillus uzonensis]
MNVRTDRRNIAIIAHVDHGKTTLVDQLLKQSGAFKAHEQIEERVLDSNDLERERGITILAKNTAIQYGDYVINILDTPGHADFSGEVERILKMVDGVLLVVDAVEGCMPQTRFVLKKALENKLAPVVVVNKIDREQARPLEVVDEVLDLFIDLGADENQLDFPVVYTSALAGTSSLDPASQGEDMQALFEAIIEHIPGPQVELDKPLQCQVTMLDYNDYLGRIAIGRIYRGALSVNEPVAVVKRDGQVQRARITKLFGFLGLKRVEIETAQAGDIVAIAGLEDINVGETVCAPDHPDPLPLLDIEEPTLKMTFLVNNSPFAGREGKHVTGSKLRERLMRELETDVSLRVEDTDNPEAFIVSGRGELHLSILIENMRREGYEFQVSKPEVITREVDGVEMEPFERLIADLPEEYMGPVMEALGRRKGEMLNMSHTSPGHVRLEFRVPSRGLIGYRTEFLTQTRGYGIMTHSFEKYQPLIKAQLGGRRFGALIAHETGKATTYGLLHVEDRGVLFITPGVEVYEGMIVGEHSRENDLVVNVCKEKHVTNMRSATKEETVKLKAHRQLSLEEALQFLNEDEYCEVTPASIRLRKKYLKKWERERAEKEKRFKHS